MCSSSEGGDSRTGCLLYCQKAKDEDRKDEDRLINFSGFTVYSARLIDCTHCVFVCDFIRMPSRLL